MPLCGTVVVIVVDGLERIRMKRMSQLLKKVNEMDKPVDLTDASFENAVSENKVTVVDFWAPWCGPCRAMAPVIDELAKDHAGKIAFGKLNVDENRQVAAKYQIMSIPTLLVFRSGELVDRITGALPKNALEPRLAQHLS